MLITPDMSEIKEDVAPGEYKVRIVKVEDGQWDTQKGITKYLNWTLETFDETEPKNNGRRIWHKTPYTGAGAFCFTNFYKAATGEQYNPGEPFDTEMLIGRELSVVVQQQKNNPQYTEVTAEKSLA